MLSLKNGAKYKKKKKDGEKNRFNQKENERKGLTGNHFFFLPIFKNVFGGEKGSTMQSVWQGNERLGGNHPQGESAKR